MNIFEQLITGDITDPGMLADIEANREEPLPGNVIPDDEEWTGWYQDQS